MNSQKTILGFILGLIILTSLAPAINAQEQSEIIYASKDTFTDASSPYNNFGTSTFMYCGYKFGMSCDVYLFFNFESIQGWSEVKLYLNIRDAPVPLQFLITQYNINWNEFELTYENSEFIKTGGYSWDLSNGINTIFVGDLISSGKKELSVCIYAANDQSDYLYITSREYATGEQGPRLVFIEPFILTRLVPLIFIIIGFVGLITIFIVLYKRHKRIKSVKRVVEREKTSSTPVVISREIKSKPIAIKVQMANYCAMCGVKLEDFARFCHNCGFEVDN